jgi:hypothetical protein
MAIESKAAPAPPAPAETNDAGYAAKLGGKIRKYKDLAAEYKTRLDTVEKELADLRARPVDKTAVQLQAELRELKHRQVFDKVATDLKARPEALDDLWKLSGYTPEADAVDEAALKTLIAEQARTRGYLFDGTATPPAEGKAPAPARTEPGPGNSRGGLVHDAGTVKLSRSFMKSDDYGPAQQKLYSDAIASGNYEFVP